MRRVALVSIALGALALVGGALSDEHSTFRAIRAVLAELAIDTGETSGLDVLDDASVLVVVEVAGSEMIVQREASVPRHLDAWCTSTGKVLLAGLSDDEIVERFARDVDAYDGSSVARYASLLDELEAFLADWKKTGQTIV